MPTKSKFHPDSTVPKSGIFVFGSNLSGVHGAGAAKAAHKYFGAEWGNPHGRQGNSYAIPTKNASISTTLPLPAIRDFVIEFAQYALSHPELEFFITRVACGLAGCKDSQIAPMFRDAGCCELQNCSFPSPWQQYLVDDTQSPITL
jgi:hypothetical protein